MIMPHKRKIIQDKIGPPTKTLAFTLIELFTVRKRKAFTLIELLVVVAVIGILATVVVVNISSAQKKARDAKRKSDLNAMKTALSLYYNDNNVYPSTGTAGGQENCWKWSMNNDSYTACTDKWSAFGASMQSYLPSLPNDPKKKGNVFYTGNYNYAYYSGDQKSYVMIMRLENQSDSDRCEHRQYNWSSGKLCPDDNGVNFNWTGTNYLYKLTN